ncbi:MAG: DedA family protein [Phycisphaerae bacterium]
MPTDHKPPPTPDPGVTDDIIEEEVRSHWTARLFSPVRRLYEWVLGWAETPYAGTAMGVLAWSEAVFFPVPADVLLMALCLGRPKRSFWWAAICSFWSIVGAMTAMVAGKYLVGQERVLAAMSAVHLGPQAERALTLFHDYGFLAVGAAAFTPIPYKVFAWLAGFAEMHWATFLAASLIFRSLRFYSVAAVMYIFGPPARRFIDQYFNLCTVLLMLLVIGVVLLLKVL